MLATGGSPRPIALVVMPPLKPYLPAAALCATGFALALGLQTYGNKISFAPNAAAAAPFAAPFALLATGTAACFTLAAASLCSVSPRKF